MRTTSVAVYKEINESGLLSKRRLEVYNILATFGEMTSGEVFSKIMKERDMNGISQSRARFTELRQMGVIEEVGTKKCRVTGHNVILWGITNQLPKKLTKKSKPKGWISIEKSKPRQSQFVLICDNRKEIDDEDLDEVNELIKSKEIHSDDMQQIFYPVLVAMYNSELNIFLVPDPAQGMITLEVSHWMELPNAPKRQ